MRPSIVESRFEALRGSALGPLIGRDEEIDLLLAALGTRTRSGDGQVVLVSGEPGIGKSRIVAELAERLARRSRISDCAISARRYHRDSALFPFIDQLGRASGLAARTRLWSS